MPPPDPPAAAANHPPSTNSTRIDPSKAPVISSIPTPDHDTRNSTLYITLPSVLFCVGFAALTLCVLGWKFGWCGQQRHRLRAAQDEAGDLIREDREERGRTEACMVEAGMEDRRRAREAGVGEGDVEEKQKTSEMVEEKNGGEAERRTKRWKARLDEGRRRSFQGLTKTGVAWDGF